MLSSVESSIIPFLDNTIRPPLKATVAHIYLSYLLSSADNNIKPFLDGNIRTNLNIGISSRYNNLQQIAISGDNVLQTADKLKNILKLFNNTHVFEPNTSKKPFSILSGW